jgi:serine protease
MTRVTSTITATSLAIAIAAAMVAAPTAYSAGKSSTRIKGSTPMLAKQASELSEFDSFIISYRKGAKANATTHRQHLQAAARKLGIRISPRQDLSTGARVIAIDRKLGKAASKRLALELMKDPGVRAVEPNRRLYRAFTPNDPLFPQQWHYANGPGGIDLEGGWNKAHGDGIVVAVIDTGSTPHADLAGQYVAGYDFISDASIARDGDGRDDNPNDEGDWQQWECGFPSKSSWHGTHVAGTVAAATDNNVGVAGVAFGARVQPVRVLGKCGGSLEDIADAIVWASGGSVPGVPANDNPAEVVNLSLGVGGACSVVLQDAVNIATGNGSVVVVAAGNAGVDAANFQPANCAGVVSVAATTPTGALADYSNFGTIVSVAAPGGAGGLSSQDNVLSTINAGESTQGADAYAWSAGTSMAAPHVAGVVALMQSVASTPLKPSAVKTILENTAYAANGLVPECAGRDLRCGAGIIDASMAVAVAAGDADLPPAPPGPPPPPAPIQLQNGIAVTGISVLSEREIMYVLDVPSNASDVTFTMAGGVGDADLYVLFGEHPTDNHWDCRPWADGNNEACSFDNPSAGHWFVRVRGYAAASNVSLTGRYTSVGEAPPTGLSAPYVFALKGRVRVPLTWTGGRSQVDIRFNGTVAATVRNTGRFTHTFAGRSGTASYRVCNAGTDQCSQRIDVAYNSRN